MPLLDEKTKKWLHWDPIWNQICPYSPLGQTFKGQLPPFAPCDFAAWQKEMQDMSRMRAAQKDRFFVEAIRKQLSQLRPIENQLSLISDGLLPGKADFFEIKQ